MQSATLYCANKRITYKAVWNNTQHIPRHKRPANPKRTTSRFYQGRGSLNQTTDLNFKTPNLPLLSTKRAKNSSQFENLEMIEQQGLEGVLTNAKKEISSVPTRRSNKLITSTDDRESVLSPEAMVLVEEARHKAGRKNSLLSSEEMVIPNITSTGKISERYPPLLPSSVASQTSNKSPNPRNGVESVAGFTESGIESIEQLRPFHEIAGKALASIPQNESIFPTVGKIDSVIQEETKAKTKRGSQKQTPRVSPDRKVPRLAYNQMSSQILDTIFPPLRQVHQSSARLSKVLEKFSIKRPDIETVRLWQYQNEIAKKKAEKQKSNQTKRNNDFNSKLKAKYKKMVIRKKGELVEFGSMRSSSHRVDSLYQTAYPVGSYKGFDISGEEKTRQLRQEHHSMLKEMVDKPFNEIDGFNQTGEILSPLNKTSPIQMTIQHPPLLQTGQSFWGGGHQSGRRKNAARSPTASPTFGGGNLLHQESQEIEGTFRERMSPNPHLDEVEKSVAVGLQGKRFSQGLNSPSLAKVPMAQEMQLDERGENDEIINQFKEKQRKSLVVLNHVPPQVQMKRYGGSLRESHESISGISATTRGILSRPSPMPQTKIPVASTHTSGENQNLLPPLNNQIQTAQLKKGHLVETAKLPPPQSVQNQLHNKSHFSKESGRKDPTPSRRDKQQKSVPAKKKLRPIKARKSIEVASKSICKHITLEIPLPQENQRGMLPRQAGGASTVSMAPINQSPLLTVGKNNLPGHSPLIKPTILGKGMANITPTMYPQSEAVHGVEINHRIDSPMTHNFETHKNYLLINDSMEGPRSIYSRKETPHKREVENQGLQDTPTPAYNHANFEVSMGDEVGELGEMQQFLNEFSDELMVREDQEIAKEEENTPLIQNIRLMNEHVTQKVKSAFKTNLRLIKQEKSRMVPSGGVTLRSLETPEDVHQTSMYRTSLGFNVSSNVANQFIRLLNNSNRRKARKFKDADLLYQYQTMSMAKPLQNKNPFHNEALLMHQTTTADFDPIQYEIEPRVNSVRIKIQDIPIKKANLDLSFRNTLKRSGQVSKRHSSNFTLHSGPGSPRLHKLVDSKDSLTVMGENVHGDYEAQETFMPHDQLPTSKPGNVVRNVFSKVASSVNKIKAEIEDEINLGLVSRSMEEKGLSPASQQIA